jgi:hypothetical protein
MNENYNNILKKIGNKQPFSVPENYFENLASDLEKKIVLEKKKKASPTIVPLFQKVKPYIYAAAVFACIWVMGNFMLDKTMDANNNVASSEQDFLGSQEQTDLLLAYVDEYTLIEYLAEDSNKD